jgi:hypothetical protein
VIPFLRGAVQLLGGSGGDFFPGGACRSQKKMMMLEIASSGSDMISKLAGTC